MWSILGVPLGFLLLWIVLFIVEKLPIDKNPIILIRKIFFKEIIDKINDMKEDINDKFLSINKKIDDNERDRIRETILSYKKSIDNGIQLNEHDYEYILKIYDKYDKVLKGNSFVKEIVEEIEKYYKEQKNK